MTKQVLAVALCRVSSIEQLESNSLGHQKGNVLKCASELGAVIPDDAVWEGAVSSKKGVNFNRKDLREMYEYCRKNPAVKYLIVQEVDRFMRSPDEQTYFYVKFWYELRVRIWFADKPELNEDTHVASLLRYMEGWRAAGSNEERQNKSISGQTAALKEGRYPFSPKPGYIRGYERGVQEPHPVRGPILKATLLQIAQRLATPTQALVEFNKTEFFAGGKAKYKMDKFRKIVTDPFYAGIVEIDKQVKVRNENGLHSPLITKEQHTRLVQIMTDKHKNQKGPRKNGNPKYPASNLVTHTSCKDSSIGRLVGFDHTNGKNMKKIYEKYRCRACGSYITRQELHDEIKRLFKATPITQAGLRHLTKALDVVWDKKEGEAEQDKHRISHKIKLLREGVISQVEAATDSGNAAIKVEILALIASKKAEIAELEEQEDRLSEKAESDRKRFLQFAFDFISNTNKRYFEASKDNQVRCKQLVFPGGFYLNSENKVYTPEVSVLYRLAANKKDLSEPEKSLLVRVRGLKPLASSMARKRSIN